MICGTPAPVTTRVVQIDPGPMPTLTASTPASINSARAFAGADIAGDQIWCRDDGCLISRTASITRNEWPCAVSITKQSTRAFTNSSARSR